MYWKKITYSKSQLYIPLKDNMLHYITQTYVVSLQSYLGEACSWQQWHERGTVVVWDVWQQRGTTQTCLNPQHHTPMCHQSGYQGSCQTDVAWGGSLTDLCWDGNVETPRWGPLHWNRQDKTITTSSYNTDGFVRHCCNSINNILDLQQSYTNSSIYPANWSNEW